jgi:hypothetical protein
MKVVINTHPRYQNPLKIVLDSLNYKDHLSDIIVCISDVKDGESNTIIQHYKTTFGLLNVITCPDNIDEYTAYIGLGKALRDGHFPGEEHFLMIHDTCEAGRTFWLKLGELDTSFRGPVFKYIPETCTFKTDDPILHQISIMDGTSLSMHFHEFLYIEGKLATSCPYTEDGKTKKFVGYLANDCLITQSLEHAMEFKSSNLDDIQDTIDSGYMWYPVSANFNIGVATRTFVEDYAGKAFEGLKFTKEESIDVEINPDNPLNLQKQAGDNWRFAYCKSGDKSACRIPTMSIWANDTDVYGDGHKRNVSFMHALDLKKYSVLVGKAWLPSHPHRA